MSKSRKQAFEYIKQKVWLRIQGWQEKLLSKVGKEVLIKAVAQAIPTYAMSCFDLTKGLCDELSSMIARWWWSQQDKTNKIHWLSWEKLTMSKENGGLGFRDLHLFNIAMLARQAWRLLTNPGTLCARVLKAKYYPHTDVLHSSAKDGISYSWRSILKGVELLKEGLIWRVGDVNSLKIWKDPWIPRSSTRKPITPRAGSILTKVSELIDPVLGEWDEALIDDNFWNVDAEEIKKIPLHDGVDDWAAWRYDPKGVFSVKSAYKVAVRKRDMGSGRDASSSSGSVYGTHTFDWLKIWRCKVAHKVQMFVWWFTHNSLAVRCNLARKGVEIDKICPVCKRFDEDNGHLFFKCKNARACWLALNLERERKIMVQCQSGKEAMSKLWTFAETTQQKILTFMWRWWLARNKVNVGEKMSSTWDTCQSVEFHLGEQERISKKNSQAKQPTVQR